VLSLFDNVIGMQLDEADGMIYQGMKVIKIRDSAFAPTVTKLVIPNATASDGFARPSIAGDAGQS
jgi:circadian clock protein KaiC